MKEKTNNSSKKYRPRTKDGASVGYKTISLTLHEKVIDFLETVNSDNNSEFIEKNVSKMDIEEMPKRRELKTFPIKKTFTFTKNFVKKIKKSGNMSLFIEKKLIEIFKI